MSKRGGLMSLKTRAGRRCRAVGILRVVLLGVVLALWLPPCGAQAAAVAGADMVPIPSYTYVHDPSMAKEGKTWYLFSTGDPSSLENGGDIQIRESTNLRTWRLVGTVFSSIPAWITDKLGPIPNLWAPDISYFGGRWHLYYAASTFGSNRSIIALATNVTLDLKNPKYHWSDDGEVFSSDGPDDFNAIDPALAAGPDGSKWLVFGSFWSGIKLIRLVTSTGKPASTRVKLVTLSQAPSPDAEEGAYLVAHGQYYYLFVSVGYCCKGIGSTYQIVVGRSADITGPYLDPNGTTMTDGGGMELLGSSQGMIGPGSPSVYVSPSEDLIVYHYYDAWDNGDPWVQVRGLEWAPAGWPVTGPAMVPVPGSP